MARQSDDDNMLLFCAVRFITEQGLHSSFMFALTRLSQDVNADRVARGEQPLKEL